MHNLLYYIYTVLFNIRLLLYYIILYHIILHLSHNILWIYTKMISKRLRRASMTL